MNAIKIRVHYRSGFEATKENRIKLFSGSGTGTKRIRRQKQTQLTDGAFDIKQRYTTRYLVGELVNGKTLIEKSSRMIKSCIKMFNANCEIRTENEDEEEVLLISLRR